MSSAGAQGDVAALQTYFCHQCACHVTKNSSPSGDISCSRCGGGFIEEVENPNPNPNPRPNTSVFFSSPSSSPPDSFHPFMAALGPMLFGGGSVSLSDLFPRRSSSMSVSFGGDAGGGADDPSGYDPLHFLHEHLEHLRAGGANIQVVFEGGPHAGMGFHGSPSFNMGDYFIGGGLEQLIQQLMENDPNRYGPPPASESAIRSLPDIQITQEMLASDSAQCAVCKDEFEVGAKAKQMPCQHIYHQECIVPWLELHNSCPVCRYELPTDDSDNEDSMSGRSTQSSNPSTPAQPRVAERRFSVSVPWWPFGQRTAEGSNAGAGRGNNNNSGNNDGGGSSGNQGNRPETNSEDLD
ncbi:E3 ubiquitin-protein ligase RING1 [Acorus calamus]|uniref:RING-type E3 ubiquitin transferase n=1 Tax=Acorus calamus TaxID=4465 RepID=A0AAV9DQD1_ACOCL|nr:E3 ubiquitin-protein ligase RING1 [Acorus calamus]